MVDPDHAALSITRQCGLLSIARSSFYYEGKGESPLNLRLMRRIDEQFLETPFYGSRQMTRWLLRQGARVSRKRVRRLMRLLGLQAIFQRPRTSQPHPAHRVYPYLLRDLPITRPNHVWCTDVTYIPLQRGFLYLVAVMDWASRHADLFRRILGRPAGRFPRPQRREPAGVEPPNQLPHILFVEIQPPGNGSRPHPLPREGDHLCAPQIRCRLRCLQDPREPPALRERQFSNIQTHVNLLWLSRLSVLDTKCD